MRIERASGWPIQIGRSRFSSSTLRRATGRLVVELREERARLRVGDPDRQVAVLVLGLEDDYRAGAKEIQVDPVDRHPGKAVSAHWLVRSSHTALCWVNPRSE